MLRLIRTIFFILFITTFSNLVLAQQKQTLDSLLQIVETNISINDQVDTYVKIAAQYRSSDSTNTAKYANKAIVLAKEFSYPKGEINALYVLGLNALKARNYAVAEDLLKKVIEKANKENYDERKADGLNSLGVIRWYQSKHEEALQYYLQALEIHKSLNDTTFIVGDYSNIGMVHHVKGDYEKALDNYLIALELIEELGDKRKGASTYHNIGVIYRQQVNYEKALEYLFKSLEIKKELGYKTELVNNYINIGIIYRYQGVLEKALEYYKLALETAKDSDYQRGIADSYTSIGVIYKTEGDYKSALDCYLKSLKIKEEQGDEKGIANCYMNIGEIYSKLGNENEAIEYSLKSIKIAQKLDLERLMASPLQTLGNVYRKKKQWGTSRKYLKQSLNIAKEKSLPTTVRDVAEEIALLEKGSGNYKAAYEYQVLFKQMADSILNEAQTKKLTRLEAEYEFEQEKDSIQFANTAQRVALEKDIKQREIVQFATLVVLSLVVALAGILFLFFRAKSRANRLLTEKSDELAKSNKKLERSNLEVKKQAENILLLNRLLEKDLDEASKDLLVKNQKLGEYAFYNSHKTRAPLARILGLIDLLKPGQVDAETAQVLDMLLESTKDLDKIVAEMNDILSEVDMYEDVKKDAEKANKGSNEFF